MVDCLFLAELMAVLVVIAVLGLTCLLYPDSGGCCFLFSESDTEAVAFLPPEWSDEYLNEVEKV